MRDVFTHTAGFTYSFMEQTVVDAMYREHGVDFTVSESDLAEVVGRLAELPLLAHSARGVELQRCHRRSRAVSSRSSPASPSIGSSRPGVFEPLGMKRHRPSRCRTTKLDRFVSMYSPSREGGLTLVEPADEAADSSGDVRMRSGRRRSRIDGSRLSALRGDAAPAAAASTASVCSAARPSPT